MTDYTHDQNIANANGSTVRADINAMALALFSESASAAAPGTTIKSQIWNDYTTFTRKRRNQANSGWIVVGTLDEALTLARSSNTILGLSDIGKTIIATSTYTQTLTAAATLGDGWFIDIRNDGVGIITLDPNSSEQINGATTLDLHPGESGMIVCNGSAFKFIGYISTGPYDRQVTTVDVNNTTSETAIYSFSVPGGVLSTNRALRLNLSGDYLNNSGGNSNLTINVKYGATTIAACALGAVSTSANRRSLRVELILAALNATNAQISRGVVSLGSAGSATGTGAAPALAHEVVHNSIAEDSTAAKTLQVTVTHSVVGLTVSATAKNVILERL